MDWREEFNRRIIDVLLANSSPVTDGDSYYGGLARDYQVVRTHISQCEPDYARCSWDDSEWTEFTSTFELPRDAKGIDLTFTCKCGHLADRKFRYTDGHAELLRLLTA